MREHLLKAIVSHRVGNRHPDVVNRVSSNDGVNLIRYSLNHGKKLVTNYMEVEYLLKVVALFRHGSFRRV
uniref:Uncharacterized protein n=1 Tax=Candidatus Methanogaster sp. ANME-2c ERB4 TaxID=2759911 RepID=A0A7G9YGB1_9EURY|nr:hypothetical protein NBCJMJBN_00006 [Methanosarcinales archaeon ANME-2c ERB4]